MDLILENTLVKYREDKWQLIFPFPKDFNTSWQYLTLIRHRLTHTVKYIYFVHFKTFTVLDKLSTGWRKLQMRWNTLKYSLNKFRVKKWVYFSLKFYVMICNYSYIETNYYCSIPIPCFIRGMLSILYVILRSTNTIMLLYPIVLSFKC